MPVARACPIRAQPHDQSDRQESQRASFARFLVHAQIPNPTGVLINSLRAPLTECFVPRPPHPSAVSPPLPPLAPFLQSSPNRRWSHPPSCAFLPLASAPRSAAAPALRSSRAPAAALLV